MIRQGNKVIFPIYLKQLINLRYRGDRVCRALASHIYCKGLIVG